MQRDAPAHASPADDRYERLLIDLTDPQREAVLHRDGPMLVLAGAGSGKTRVITRRAAHLASTIARPWQVLAITFTNKAAGEMQERIAALGVDGDMPVSTFHSFCARTLRIHHERAGLAGDFTIADQGDRRELVRKAVERAELSPSNWPAGMVEARISRAKNAMTSPRALEADATDWADRTIARIFSVYEEILAEQHLLDFDDLLLRTARLLETDEELRSKLEDRFQYVLVDEYQDTNVAQYLIAHLLTRDRHNLFVTGDPDQSIYGWRGADINNILSFERDHPDAKVVRLERNYRSTKRILAVAGALISANTHRRAKDLWTENELGGAVRVFTFDDGETEATGIVTAIAEEIASGRAPRDIAVFYRVNAQSRAIEEAMFQAGVKYRIARGVAFYARKEIKDVLAYLRVAVNPLDEVSLVRIINTPSRGIGKTTLDRLRAYAQANGCALKDAVEQVERIGLARRALNAVTEFRELLATLRGLRDTSARESLEQTLSRSGLWAALSQQADANREPQRNVEELVSAATAFERTHPGGTLLDWLTFTSLLGDDDRIDGADGSVTLMTLHAAKGLEFPVVTIAGVESRLLPFTRGRDTADDEEEERRLLFVGVTRAKERLTLTHAKWRMLRGVSQPDEASPFLDDLPEDDVEWVNATGSNRRSTLAIGVGKLPDDIEQWSVGVLVRHPDYGLGQVIGLTRGSRRTHVEVQFESGESRSWILEFAPLQRVDFDEVG